MNTDMNQFLTIVKDLTNIRAYLSTEVVRKMKAYQLKALLLC